MDEDSSGGSHQDPNSQTRNKRGRRVTDDDAADERARRRREINRNSQKRIRERRSKEVDDLRDQIAQLNEDNEALLTQAEALTLEKADMLRQIHELTEKWQQSIAENAWLNRENIQLRSSLQQLNALITGGSHAGGALAALRGPPDTSKP